jgi:hypothetical protein
LSALSHSATEQQQQQQEQQSTCVVRAWRTIGVHAWWLLLLLLVSLPESLSVAGERGWLLAWMVFQRQFAVCSLDLIVCGMLWDVEQVIEVPAGHCRSQAQQHNAY